MLLILFALCLILQKACGLYCYCAGHCPFDRPNGTCLARPNSQCFSAVEQVFNAATGLLEDERTYGCLPPDETGFMQCKGHLVPHEIPKSIACCAHEDLCNRHLAPPNRPRPVTRSPMFRGERMSYESPYHLLTFIAAFSVCFLIFIVVVICMLIRLRRQKKQRGWRLDCEGKGGEALLDGASVDTSGSGSGMALLVQRTIGKQLEMLESIGRGRFGEVWKARLRDDLVAVKIFFTSEEASWARETDIYKTVLLRHSNILGYVAADIRGNGSWTQMILITDYVELGSLHDFLRRAEKLEPVHALRLSHSASCGLAHLHVEVCGKQGKPAIAHRDIKSRNILVKRDMTCVIADFGLAVKYKSATDELDVGAGARVGTRRYMAPEVLDETLDAAHFDAYKMADVYSFALVLWEVAHRCSLHGHVEEYQLPYYDCVPSNPSFEDMKKVVCVDQTRPSIPKHWNDSEVLQTLGRVMSEGWKQTAGARLTALRIKKTLSRLESLQHKTRSDSPLW